MVRPGDRTSFIAGGDACAHRTGRCFCSAFLFVSFSCRFRVVFEIYSFWAFSLPISLLTYKNYAAWIGKEDVGRWKMMECWQEGSDLLKKGSYVLKNQFEPCVCHFFFVPLRRVLYHVVYEVPFFS